MAEIREAIDFAERAFAVVRASLRPEQTEKEIAYELEHQIRLFGGRGCSFTPIVGVGPRGALPHADAVGSSRGRKRLRLDRLGGPRPAVPERLDAGSGHR